MRYGRLVVAAALAVGQCSLVNANPSLTAAPPPNEKQQADFAAVAQSSGANPVGLNPAATTPGPDIRVAPELYHPKEIIKLIPGHMTEIELDWNISSVHVGDDKLIDVTPIGDKKLLVKALGITENDQDKRPRPPVSRSNFYVIGDDNKKRDVYEVVIENYPNNRQVNSSPSAQTPLTRKQPNVEIYTKSLVQPFNYECDHSDCKLNGTSPQ